MKITALIVDDEEGARESLSNLLARYAPDIEVLGTASNVKDAKRMIDLNEPDVVFLDIEMPFASGFDLLKSYAEVPFDVVFVTAYDQYAVQAIKCSALDYLLKPVDPDELIAVVEHIKNHQAPIQAKQVDALMQNMENRNELRIIAIPDRTGYEFVKLDDILRLESDGNYTFFHIDGKKKILSSKTLSEYADWLEGHKFIRIHRSHLVNTQFIQKYEKGDGGFVLMKDGTKVEVSRRKKNDFLSKFFVQ